MIDMGAIQESMALTTIKPQIFEFETDFAGTLACIPMIVRFKLDQCGIKLSLRQGSRFDLQERKQLVNQPCEAQQDVKVYREALVSLIETRTSEWAVELATYPAPAWRDRTEVPQCVVSFSACAGLSPPTLAQWAKLGPLQRFALVKLSRPGHDNENLLPAMVEFGVTSHTARPGG